ncbi:MAG: LPS export ABC transporter permease LptG [Pseudomonadota bacterium]
MQLLNKHIGNSVLAAIILVLVVIVGLDVISAIIDQLGDLEGNYDFNEALIYVLLTLPGRIHEYIPFAALVGCLIGLGTLASQSELIIMRGAGISTIRIIWMVMKPALILMLVGLILSEFIAPPAEQMADRRRASAQYGDGVVASRYGLWNREGLEYMHFSVVESPQSLKGVTLFRFDANKQLKQFLFAQAASHTDEGWLFSNVDVTYVEENATKKEHLDALLWQADLTPELLKQLVIKPDNLSMSGLWDFSQYLAGQGLSAGEYKLSFWSKVLQPLGTASLVLIAISFIFGPLREVTMGYRIFVGVIVGIVFRTSQDMLGPSSLVFGFAPVYAVLLPIIVCVVVGGILIRRGT